MTSLVIDNVSVTIPVFEVSGRSLRKTLARIGQRNALADADDGVIQVHALTDINFTLEHGDCLGLIGENGAGKSTLLRVMAGIYKPQEGTVVREGKAVPLLDLTLCLDDNSTGRQNIHLRGLFLGLTPAQINAKENDIIAFSELGDYIDMPVRTYSSGMRMRLAFSISMAVEADILLLDEVLAVGDSAFQAKAKARLKEISGRAGIVVMALHSSPAIMEFCNKALWLQHGKMRMLGECHEVVRAYDDFMHGRI